VKDHLWIQRVVIDPTDAKTVYLTFSGYREGDNEPYVIRSPTADSPGRTSPATFRMRR